MILWTPWDGRPYIYPDVQYFSETEIEWCMMSGACTQHLDSGIATFAKLLLNYCEPWL